MVRLGFTQKRPLAAAVGRRTLDGLVTNLFDHQRAWELERIRGHAHTNDGCLATAPQVDRVDEGDGCAGAPGEQPLSGGYYL